MSVMFCKSNENLTETRLVNVFSKIDNDIASRNSGESVQTILFLLRYIILCVSKL